MSVQQDQGENDAIAMYMVMRATERGETIGTLDFADTARASWERLPNATKTTYRKMRDLYKDANNLLRRS